MISKTTLFKILFIACLAFCQTSNGQLESVEWITSSGDGAINTKFLNDIARDSEGNIYITGYFTGSVTFGDTLLNSSSNTTQTSFIAKYSSTGEIIWAKKLSSNIFTKAFAVTTDQDGNVFVTGYFVGNSLNLGNILLTPQFYPDGQSCFIAKIDPQGNTIWGKLIEMSSKLPGITADIAADSNGNIVITGNYNGTAKTEDILFTTTGYGTFIGKYNTDGNLLWINEPQGTLVQSGGLAIDDSDNIFTTGKYSGVVSFGSFSVNSSGVFTAKYLTDGSVAWVKSGINSDSGQNSNSIDTDDAGNVAITGSYSSPITFGNITLPVDLNRNNAFTTKYDNLGTVLWAKAGVVDAANPMGAAGLKAKFDGNGNLYIYGSIQPNTTFDGIVFEHDITLNTQSSFLLRYSADGNANWGKKVNETKRQNLLGLAFTESNHIIISGTCNDNALFGTQNVTNGGIFLAKLASPALSNEEFILGNNITLFPNPVKDVMNINSKENIDQLNIYNTLGQKVQSFNNLNVWEYSIDLSSLNAGYYLVEIVSDKSRSQQKIIKL